MNKLQILIQYWGYSQFRPLQDEIIDSVLAGNDTLALMPTGGGKSICFQVPALVNEGICIVVTPLIALMKDQVQQLNHRGISAIAIYSGMHTREIDLSLERCVHGEIKFLYVSPERLETEIFQVRLPAMKVNLLAIDEAHCISQWGYDFRPSYLRIADIRELIPGIPVLAVTATATPEVVEDIQKQLHFRKPNLFQMSFERRNLTYNVSYQEDKHSRMLQLLERFPGCAIVYVRNRRKTKEIATFLMENRISCHFYHAGLTPEERDRKQADWIHNRVRVMISTNAFGMGIDKPDVRLVMHFDIPDSLEAYFQEAGRAGRDGKPAVAELIYHKSDLVELQHNFQNAFPEPSYMKEVYNALGNFLCLAVGSGINEYMDFEISQFSTNYKLNPLLVHNSIKFLEKEGYLVLTEPMSQPSRMMIHVSREELYRQMVKNPKLGDFIDVLIRSFSGLFTDFSVIDEYALAQRLKSSVVLVENTLKLLHTHQLITYIPRNTKPQVSFTDGRLQKNDLHINLGRYDSLKTTALNRLKAIKHYVSSTTHCRSEMLLQYFGQKETQRCGQCDYCLGRNELGLSQQEFNQVLELIKPILSVEYLRLDELLKRINYQEDDKVIKVVRWLVETGKIMRFGDKLVWEASTN